MTRSEPIQRVTPQIRRLGDPPETSPACGVTRMVGSAGGVRTPPYAAFACSELAPGGPPHGDRCLTPDVETGSPRPIVSLARGQRRQRTPAPTDVWMST